MLCLPRSLTTFLATQLAGPRPETLTLTLSKVSKLNSENDKLISGNLSQTSLTNYQLSLGESLSYSSAVLSQIEIFWTAPHLSALCNTRGV